MWNRNPEPDAMLGPDRGRTLTTIGAMSRLPLFIHIGLQKTGTSYLQSIFWHNQSQLAAQGLDLVPGSKRDTFNLMLNVRDRYQPDFDPPEVAGALAALPGQLARLSGSRALITEESLAPASDAQIRALLRACEGREVHVILTLRDLGRQIPSAWQQVLQSGGTVSFERYLRRLAKQRGEADAKVWVNKDVVGVLRRWGAHVPPDRIHIVTVPPKGAAPEELLHRFCAVIGVDVAQLDQEVGRLNESLGRAQAEVLAQVNSRLAKQDRRRDIYGDVGKRFLAVKMLVPQRGDRILIPARHRAWVTDFSATYVDAVTSGGYPVSGDVADLIPAPSAFADHDREPSDREVADAAIAALAGVVTDRADGIRRRRANDGRKGLVKRLGFLQRRPGH